MTRTPTKPPDGPQMWRRAAAREDHKVSVSFDTNLEFATLTRRALKLADGLVEPLCGNLLRLLSDCEEAYTGPLKRQQEKGATFRQLAAIGRTVGMSTPERVRWYRIAEDIPLSRRHAGHILARLKRQAA